MSSEEVVGDGDTPQVSERVQVSLHMHRRETDYRPEALHCPVLLRDVY